MAMSKQDFVALADAVKEFNFTKDRGYFTFEHVKVLADFCQLQNPRFNRQRWLRYIAGECGPNGGSIKA